MTLFKLGIKSLYNRKTSAFLTILALMVSIMLLLGVERVRSGTQESFMRTLSNTDLIVGSKSSSLQLLLYTVFRLGDAPDNISWKSYREIAELKEVKWTVPISLGDSHKGYRVLGTNNDYFRYYKYSKNSLLKLAEGREFSDIYHAVLGAEVAEKLSYSLGDSITLSHGITDTGPEHGDQPFIVEGILERTGTPVDRTIHIKLEGIEAIHVDWKKGAIPQEGEMTPQDKIRQMDLTPGSITSFLVGLNSKMTIFTFQRRINRYNREALSAIMPGVALQQLWGVMNIADTALKVIIAFVFFSGFIVLLTTVLNSLKERQREIAILRSVGLGAGKIFQLLILESFLLTLISLINALLFLYLFIWLFSPLLEANAGLYLNLWQFSAYDGAACALFLITGVLVGIIPGIKAYKTSLSTGLTQKI